jgi:hypothetical protein
MSFDLKFTAKDHSDAYQKIGNATLPMGVVTILHNVISTMADGAFAVAASGHFDKDGGEATVKISRGGAAAGAAPAHAVPQALPRGSA